VNVGGEYWGELYLRSTRPFLSEETAAREVAYLERAFAGVPGPLLDVGCGEGRHAGPLGRSRGDVLGLDIDRLSLASRRPGFTAVRGDFRALPFGRSSLGGAYAWYSTLFIGSDEQNARVLSEVARALRPKGRLVLHTVPYERLAAQPTARFERTLPDGSHLAEASAFDPVTGVDRGERRLALPDGRVLCGTYSIRYYPRPELLSLLRAMGLAVLWEHGDLDGAHASPTSTDLIIGAERKDA